MLTLIDRPRQGRKAVICTILLTAGLFLPLSCQNVFAARSTTLTTNAVDDLTPDFTVPGAANLTILTFTISDAVNQEDLTFAQVKYNGTNLRDINAAYLFRETSGGGGSFNSSADSLLASNRSITAAIINLTLPSPYRMPRFTPVKFYVTFDVSPTAADGDTVDAKIDADGLVVEAYTWPNLTYDPPGVSKIDTSAPSSWASFSPEGWQRHQAPACMVSASDNASGLDVTTAQYRYSTNAGGNWSVWANASCSGTNGTIAPQNITATMVPFGMDSGTDNLVQFRIKDLMGNLGTSPSYVVKTDSVPPDGWSLSSPLGWYTADQRPNVYATVNDDLSGPSNRTLSAELSRDGGMSWTTVPDVNSSSPSGENPITITARAVPFDNDSGLANYIRFNASDIAGNWNVSPPFLVKIDSTPPPTPSMALEPQFTNGTSNMISWNASQDAVSGISWFKVRCDDDPDFASPLAVAEVVNASKHEFFNMTDGRRYFYDVSSIDHAGEQSDFSVPVNSTQDASPPVTRLSTTPPAPNGDNGWFTNATSLTFNASDNTSGVAVTRFSVNLGEVVNGTSVELVSDGEYMVRFWSEDQVNNVEENHIAFLKIDRTPPAASMRLPQSIYQNEPASFDGSLSTDAVHYGWDFGDGSAPATGPFANHTYSQQGSYFVTLTVEDRAGLTCSTQAAVKVFIRGVNYPPEAIIAPLQSIFVSDVVIFDGSGSTDEEPSTLWYEWDFGDNNTATGKKAEHAYFREGAYSVKLKVTDSAGLFDIANRSIRVYVKGENHPPLALINQRNLAYADEPVLFDASASSDEDIANATFFWDFGDGSAARGVLVSHVYTVDSTFLVRLNVTDAAGLTGSAEFSVRVFLRGTNLPPNAQFTFSPSEPIAKQAVEFDASLTMDEDTFTLNYTWDFGDGSGAQGKLANHTYARKGDFEVKLRVRDRGGLTDLYSYRIAVLDGGGTRPPGPGTDNGWMLWAGAGVMAAALVIPLAIFAVSRRKKKVEPQVPADTQKSHAVEGPVSLIAPIPSDETPPDLVVETGLNYLLDADHPAVAFNALGKLTSEGDKGLMITAVHPKKVAKIGELQNTQVVWLSEITGEEPSIDPAKMEHELFEKVADFIKENRETGVVLIDGLELLTQYHGFDKVLQFVHSVNEVASVNEATVLVNVHSKAMKDVEFNQLKRKFDRW